MSGLRSFLLVSALAFAALAYLTYEPLPEGITQHHMIRPTLAIFKLVANTAMTADRLGFDGPALFRSILKYLELLLGSKPDLNVSTKDMDFNGVPVRIYTPNTEATITTPPRTILYLHGGGWVIGNVDGYDTLCKMLCLDLKAMLVFVEYRLAPEHVYPAAIDDVFTAAEYLIKHTKSLNADPKRIAVLGDSAGGNLGAAVTQRIKDSKLKPKLKLQVLIYPALQATDFDTPSMRFNADGPLLTRDLTLWFYNHYLFGDQRNVEKLRVNNHTHPHVKQNMPLKYMKPEHLPDDEILRDYKPNPPFGGDIEFWNYYKPIFMGSDLAPAMTKTADIAGLPHTYIVSCQYDVLRDDSFHYAARLRKENVSVEHVNLRACLHGWWNGNNIRSVDTFRKHYQMVIDYVDKKL